MECTIQLGEKTVRFTVEIGAINAAKNKDPEALKALSWFITQAFKDLLNE